MKSRRSRSSSLFLAYASRSLAVDNAHYDSEQGRLKSLIGNCFLNAQQFIYRPTVMVRVEVAAREPRQLATWPVKTMLTEQPSLSTTVNRA
jgi:hypothetical protein